MSKIYKRYFKHMNKDAWGLARAKYSGGGFRDTRAVAPLQSKLHNGRQKCRHSIKQQRLLTHSSAKSYEIPGSLGLGLHPTGFWAVSNQPLDTAYSRIPACWSLLPLLGSEPYSSLWTSKPRASDTLNITPS
jgi:hypothetical protein